MDGCENCEIRLMDRMAQVQVDYCKDSKILIGPVPGSIFIRNCERCTIIAACQQLRTRECVDCDLVLLIPGHPIIETSRDIRFGPMPEDFYPELKAQMEEAKLSIPKNDWNNIYDFSKENPPNCVHWTLQSSEDTSKVLATFPARPGPSKPTGAGDSKDSREVRVTTKKGSQFYANLCRAYLAGKPAEGERPALEATSGVVLCGAGAATGTA